MKIPLKNPGRVASGKKLAEFNKKKKEEKHNSFPITINLSNIINRDKEDELLIEL